MTVAAFVPTKILRGPLAFAERTSPVFKKVRTSRLTPAQAAGIRYENRAHRAMESLAKTVRGTTVTYEKNPWFRYGDQNGPSSCSPDGIVWLDNYVALVIDYKYTFPAPALDKMRDLYIPVVREALAPKVIFGLIICKTLTPVAPKPIDRLSDALLGAGTTIPVLQWRGEGTIRW